MTPRRVDGKGRRDVTTAGAALPSVHADDPACRSLPLYLKATVTGDETTDIHHYRAMHAELPHEAIVDQSFAEAQWEDYRTLGEQIALLVAEANWFWLIPL